MDIDGEFHSFGAATLKALSPSEQSLAEGTASGN